MNIPSNDRDRWLDAMADHVLAQGLGAASLRPLAKAAGTSDRMLIYYFADKAGLIAAILDRVAARLTVLMVSSGANEPLPFTQCLQRTMAILGDQQFAPYMRLFLQIASESAQGHPVYSLIGERLGRVYFAWAKAQLASADDAANSQEAAMLIQRVEGMVFLRAIGLDDINALAMG
jgi:AcrR family transcriptional regulator